MFLALLVLFIGLPLLELKLLFSVSDIIGGWNTVAIVLLTGFVGAFFAKSEGRRVLVKLQRDLSTGVLPADSLLSGLLIFIGGFLLITPGFVTDVLGLSFVFAFSRKFWIARLKKSLEKAARSGRINVQSYSNVNGFESYYSSSDTAREKQVFEAKVLDFEQKKQERDVEELNQ